MPLGKRAAAELIGTFWLVFGGCGSAVLAAAFPTLGIEMRWISVRPRPIAMGANPCGARLSVEPRIIIRNMKVRTASATRQAIME